MPQVPNLRYCANGEWKESRTQRYMPVTNSSTGELIARAPCCTSDEVNEAIDAARSAFPAWASTPVTRRADLMFRYRAVLDRHLDELTMLICRELGKNLDEARGDVLKAIEAVDLACSTPVLMQGDALFNVSRGFDTTMYREPVGVFAGIVPFNFPAMIPFGWMIPLCIATGNTFVLKASSQTPMTAIRMLELLIETGLPKGVVNLVTCSRNEAEILLTHPDVNGISFVGSTSTGRQVYAKAAAHGKRVQALCEAKNHALVLRDADLPNSVAAIINSTFGCAGQRCMALPVVCVEEVIADEFASLLVEAAKKRKLGPAWDPATELGPLVSAEHKQFVLGWIEKAIQEGAELILDGRGAVVKGYEGGYFVGPTIFDHVKPGMTAGASEVFGPVTFIKRVKDFNEGLAVMNSNPFANGSAIFTQSGYYAREFVRQTHAGMVGVNVGIPVPISVFPFSGHKDSFFGDLHVLGKDGVAFYTETKSVTTRWFVEGEAVKMSTWEGNISRT
jgi:malonate-semialdehyde dehydrogenase (acetylating)/methylmalonate-semialdehyde dehydrogenase